MHGLKEFLNVLGVPPFFAGTIASMLVEKYREVGEEGFKALFDQLVILVKEAAENG